MDRRQFLAAAAAGGAAVAVSPTSVGAEQASASATLPDGTSPWAAIKKQFDIAPGIVQMSSFYLASHPRPVREAIERHRRGLDQEAHGYIEGNAAHLERAVRSEASRFTSKRL
jgi:hypothetical protein